MTRSALFASMRPAPAPQAAGLNSPPAAAAGGLGQLNALESMVTAGFSSAPVASSDCRLQTREKKSLSGVQTLVVGLGWDVQSGADVDLDATVCCFGAQGQYLDSVYFGQIMNENRSIIHTGDNRTGEGDGDDEQIVLDLTKIPANVSYMQVLVSSYAGHNFNAVNSAYVRMLNASKKVLGADGKYKAEELCLFALASQGTHTSLLVGRMYRAGSEWELQTLAVPAMGRSFADVVPVMQTNLRDFVPNVQIAAAGSVVIVAKGESVPIKTSAGANPDMIKLGLGWEPASGQPAVDLDASVVMLSAGGAEVDSVFFGSPKHRVLYEGRYVQMLSSKCESLLHTGDNRSGEGDGDDETIIVHLNKIAPTVQYLYITITCYTEQPLSKLKGAFVRVMNGGDNSEMMRYDLSGLSSNSTDNALLMCKFARGGGAGGGGWQLTAIGFPCVGKYPSLLTKWMQKDIVGVTKQYV